MRRLLFIAGLALLTPSCTLLFPLDPYVSGDGGGTRMDAPGACDGRCLDDAGRDAPEPDTNGFDVPAPDVPGLDASGADAPVLCTMASDCGPPGLSSCSLGGCTVTTPAVRVDLVGSPGFVHPLLAMCAYSVIDDLFVGLVTVEGSARSLVMRYASFGNTYQEFGVPRSDLLAEPVTAVENVTAVQCRTWESGGFDATAMGEMVPSRTRAVIGVRQPEERWHFVAPVPTATDELWMVSGRDTVDPWTGWHTADGRITVHDFAGGEFTDVDPLAPDIGVPVTTTDDGPWMALRARGRLAPLRSDGALIGGTPGDLPDGPAALAWLPDGASTTTPSSGFIVHAEGANVFIDTLNCAPSSCDGRTRGGGQVVVTDAPVTLIGASALPSGGLVVAWAEESRARIRAVLLSTTTLHAGAPFDVYVAPAGSTIAAIEVASEVVPSAGLDYAVVAALVGPSTSELRARVFTIAIRP